MASWSTYKEDCKNPALGIKIVFVFQGVEIYSECRRQDFFAKNKCEYLVAEGLQTDPIGAEF